MSISIENSIDNYTFGFNPVYFNVISTDIAQPNFRYICDIYINSELKSSIKLSKNPTTNRGNFNLSNILSTFLPNNITPNSYINDSILPSTAYLEYYLEFKQEYGSPAVVDDEAIATFNGYLFYGAIDFYKFTSGAISSFIGDTGVNLQLLNNIGSNTRVDVNENGYIYYILKRSNYSIADAIKVRYYANNGTLLREYNIINQVAYEPHDAGDYYDNVLFYFGAYPKSLKETLAGNCSDSHSGSYLFPTNEGDYYTIQLINSPREELAVSDEFRFTITNKCSKYDKYEIFWLNDRGGLDKFLFNMPYRSNNIINKSTANKPINFPANATDYNSFVNNVDFNTEVTLLSDWVNDTEINLLMPLFISPKVYIYNPQLDRLLPIIITNTNAEKKSNKIDGLTQISINFVYPVNQFTQR